MDHMTLDRIAGACGGQLCGGINPEREVEGVVIDSRRVEKDYLFIAAAGERTDGHNYINTAFDQGAMAVICEKAPSAPKGPYILVKDSLTALKEIAAWYRMQLSIKIIGITGSVGKTSTKEFISSVLAQKYQVLKTEGNFNNEIGLPLTILRIRSTHEVAVLEMGISDFGEMHRLSEIARPDICVITNIGQCHLENLGSREGILRAKSEIFDFMKEDGFVCVNGDDDMLAPLKQIRGNAPVRFGIDSGNDIYAINSKSHGLFGTSCDIQIKSADALREAKHAFDETIHTDIPLPGEHMVLNALAAASVGALLGIPGREIAAGIAAVQPVGGRSHIIRHPGYTVIDDCYNANPVSMKAAIDLLNTADTKRTAILGDMFELGSTELLLHGEVGRYAAKSGLNTLICVGELSRHMFEGAFEALKERAAQTNMEPSAVMQLFYYETREKLLEALPGLVDQGSTILVKASHGMGFEKVVSVLAR